MCSFFDYLDRLDSAKSMLRTLAGFSEPMSVTIIQRSPLRKEPGPHQHIKDTSTEGRHGSEYSRGATMGVLYPGSMQQMFCTHGLLWCRNTFVLSWGVAWFRPENGSPWLYRKSTGKPWDVAEGPNFSASFTGDDLGALTGPLPTHSFQKVGRATGGIFPAGRSPLKEERGREERGREEG